MGLDCSHDAFHGAYGAFNRLRQFVCAAAGGSFPPHWKKDAAGELVLKGTLPQYDENLDQQRFYIFDDDFKSEEWPGLWEFLRHSDCDGDISPETCVKVADDLERLMPKMLELGWESHGHIKAYGGFIEVVRKFIAGCRSAAEANEPLLFY